MKLKNTILVTALALVFSFGGLAIADNAFACSSCGCSHSVEKSEKAATDTSKDANENDEKSKKSAKKSKKAKSSGCSSK